MPFSSAVENPAHDENAPLLHDDPVVEYYSKTQSTDAEHGHSDSATHKHKPPPEDTYQGAYIIFLILGTGVLFPWNTFILSFEFFKDLYPDFPFEFAVSLIYNWPSIIFLLLSVKFGAQFSFSSRIFIPFTVDFFVLLAAPCLSLIFNSKQISLGFTLLGVCLAGCATAVLFSAVMGLASLYPERYPGAVMAGNGISGLATGLLRVVSKLTLKQSTGAALLYFCLAAFVVLICIVAYWVLLKLPITKYILRKHKQHLVHHSAHYDEIQQLKNPGSYNKHHEVTSTKTVFKKIWLDCFLVFSCFFVTLSVFPGITSLVKSTQSWISDSWFSILLLCLFMVGDFVGRSAPRWVLLFQNSPKILTALISSRYAFMALFVLCVKPLIFKSNYWSIGFMLAMALSNGYFSTICMIYGPAKVDPHEKETAGLIMSFFLNFGIFVAVHFALVLLYIADPQQIENLVH